MCSAIEYQIAPPPLLSNFPALLLFLQFLLLLPLILLLYYLSCKYLCHYHYCYVEPTPRGYTHTTMILERFSRAGPRGRGRAWATLGVHPLSWLLSNNRLEKVPFVSVLHTSSNRLLLSNQDKGCTPSVAHSLPLPLGPALLNLWIMFTTQAVISLLEGSVALLWSSRLPCLRWSRSRCHNIVGS